MLRRHILNTHGDTDTNIEKKPLTIHEELWSKKFVVFGKYGETPILTLNSALVAQNAIQIAVILEDILVWSLVGSDS